MSNIAAAKELMARIAITRVAGETDALAALFTEDASFEIIGFGTPVVGRDNIRAALGALIAQFEFLEWQPLTVVAHDDDIASRHRLKVRHRPNGQVADTETAEFLSMRDGLCSSFTQFADTALIAALARA